MRRVRTLIAGTGLTLAAVALTVPAAHADTSPDFSSNGQTATTGDPHSGWDKEHDKPHGGVHTGGGGAFGGDAGLATGAVLLVGGLGVGTYVVRRRRPEGLPA